MAHTYVEIFYLNFQPIMNSYFKPLVAQQHLCIYKLISCKMCLIKHNAWKKTEKIFKYLKYTTFPANFNGCSVVTMVQISFIQKKLQIKQKYNVTLSSGNQLHRFCYAKNFLSCCKHPRQIFVTSLARARARLFFFLRSFWSFTIFYCICSSIPFSLY